MSVYLSVCGYMYECLSVSRHVCVCVDMYMSICPYMDMPVCLYVAMCIYACLSVYGYVYVCLYVQICIYSCRQGKEEGVVSPGARDAGSCELSNRSAENLTQVLCKNRKDFNPLIHCSSTSNIKHFT